jgi:hypothetical protein
MVFISKRVSGHFCDFGATFMPQEPILSWVLRVLRGMPLVCARLAFDFNASRPAT